MSSPGSYREAAARHLAAPHFTPTIPVSALPYVAFVLLLAAFFGGFTFTTLPKRGALTAEVTLAVVSSLCAGFGVVALFNAVGVQV